MPDTSWPQSGDTISLFSLHKLKTWVGIQIHRKPSQFTTEHFQNSSICLSLIQTHYKFTTDLRLLRCTIYLNIQPRVESILFCPSQYLHDHVLLRSFCIGIRLHTMVIESNNSHNITKRHGFSGMAPDLQSSKSASVPIHMWVENPPWTHKMNLKSNGFLVWGTRSLW